MSLAGCEIQTTADYRYRFAAPIDDVLRTISESDEWTKFYDSEGNTICLKARAIETVPAFVFTGTPGGVLYTLTKGAAEA